MDPLSITASILALVGAVTKTSTAVTKFARSVRDAREELTATCRELANLRMALELLRSDYNEEGISARMPATSGMATRIHSVLESCVDIMADLDSLVAKYDSKQMRWAISGKDKVISVNAQLTAHTKTLQIALDVSTL
jgi:hypothetical protein